MSGIAHAPLAAGVTVGIAGLGLMGSACAARLQAGGFGLRGFDVDAQRRDGFTGDDGRAPAASLRALAFDCAAVVLAVFDTAQAEQVADALLAAVAEGAPAPVVVCTSTCDPDRIAALAQRCEAAGMPFVEMPISGTSRSLAAGEGVGLVAGDPRSVQRALPVLEALCPRRHDLGAAGNGGRAKLVVNLVLGLHRGAMAEGLVLAERLGLDPAGFLPVLKGSAAYSRVMDVKGQAMAERRFDPPQSRVDQSLKDFALIAEQAGARGQSLPFSRVYTDLLRDCVAHGEALQDNAVIVEAIRRCAS